MGRSLGLSVVVRAVNHSIQERYIRSWEGEAPAEPHKELQRNHIPFSGIPGDDSAVALSASQPNR